jgi:antitoxin HicB
MRYAYPCALTPEKDGGYSVSFPNVPEALTCGDDRDDALAMAEDALAVALGSYMQCRERWPIGGATSFLSPSSSPMSRGGGELWATPLQYYRR